MTDAIMRAVAAGNFTAAYSTLARYTVLSRDTVEAGLKRTVAERKKPSFAKTFGKTIGVDFVGQRELAGDVLQLTYIERGQIRPLIWTFYGYRTAVGWAIVSYNWDDNVPGLFQAMF